MNQIKTLVIAAIVFLGANQISAQTKTKITLDKQWYKAV